MVFSFSVFFVTSQPTSPSPRHFASLARIRQPLPAGRELQLYLSRVHTSEGFCQSLAASERKDSSIAAGNVRAKRYERGSQQIASLKARLASD